MSDESRLDDQTLTELAHLLSRYYRDSYTETKEIVWDEDVEREVTVEETVEEVKEEDVGPHYGAYLTLLLSVIIGGVVAWEGAVTTGAVTGAIGGGIGCLLLYFWRRTEEKTITRSQEKPKTVVEEVERRDTVEEEVPPTKRVVSASRGSLRFEALDTPEGLVVSGPDPLNTTHSISFPTIDQPKTVYEATEDTEAAVEQIPWVLDGTTARYETSEETDYDGAVPLRGEEYTLQEYFQVIEEAFRDLKYPEISVSVLTSPGVFEDLVPQMTRADGSFESNSTLQTYLRGPGGTRLDQFARQWEMHWTKINFALLRARSKSLFDQVGPDCYELGTQLSYSAFNFYCPFCNEEEQEELLNRDYSVHNSADYEPIEYSKNTRCVFLPESRTWQCKTCERKTEDPIPIHRMLDEVLLPAYDHLMQENKNERLRVYSKARDKERELRERAESEIDQMRHEHMTKIFELSEEMERLQADVRGEREAIRSMERVVESFRAAQEEAREGIVEFAEKSLRRTEERQRNVEQSIDSFKNKVQEEMTKNVIEYSKTERKEQLVRDKIQMGIFENTEEMKGDMKEMKGDMKEIKKNTRKAANSLDSMKEDVKGIRKETSKSRALERAKQKKMGIDPDDESWAMNPVKKTKKSAKSMFSTLKGESSRKREERIMEE